MRKFQSIAELLPEIVSFCGDLPAFLEHKFKEGEFQFCSQTFRTFYAQILVIAKKLNQRGLKERQKVLVLVPQGKSFLLINFALFHLHCIPVIIDPGMGFLKFIKCARQVQPGAIVGLRKFRWIFYLLKPFLPKLQLFFFSARESEENSADLILSETKVSYFSSAVSKDLAAILFTSGSTGTPKGVCYEHQHFFAQLELLKTQYHWQLGEMDLPLLPVFSLFNPVLGITTVFPPMNPRKPADFDPRKMVQLIEVARVTTSFGSPRLWGKIAAFCQENAIKLSSLRQIILAGSSGHPQFLGQLSAIAPKSKIYVGYGATEALPVASIEAREVLGQTASQTKKAYGTCLGKILPGFQVKIVPFDEKTFSPSKTPIGEILVQGPTVTRSYFRQEQATQLNKIQEEDGFWHRMGDVGYLDYERYLWFCGRKVELVCTQERCYLPDHCEMIFNQHPKVFRSALIGVSDVNGNPIPAMVIELKPEFQRISENQKMVLIQELRELASVSEMTKAISLIFFDKNFPVDVRHNTKIHRLKLAQKFKNKGLMH